MALSFFGCIYPIPHKYCLEESTDKSGVYNQKGAALKISWELHDFFQKKYGRPLGMQIEGKDVSILLIYDKTNPLLEELVEIACKVSKLETVNIIDDNTHVDSQNPNLFRLHTGFTLKNENTLEWRLTLKDAHGNIVWKRAILIYKKTKD